MFKKFKTPKSSSQIIKPDMDGVSFEAEISRRSYRSERIAWLIASIAIGTTVLSIGAIWSMLPLKQTIPYYIFVNKETGAVQSVVLEDPQTITSNEANARYWVNRYVLARERYMYRLQQQDYTFVMLTSNAQVGNEYSPQFEGVNNKANVLLDKTEERVSVLSVQLTPGVTGRATVRYEKSIWRQGMREPESVKTYVADIAFEWHSVDGWGADILLQNPMGFLVTGYRSTPEMPGR